MYLYEVIEDMHQGINTVADKVIYQETGIPIIQSKNFTKGFLDLEDVRYLGREDEEKYSSKYNPHAGDILMANIGTIGRSYVIKEEQRFLIAWNAFLIKPKKEIICPDYLKYYFDYLATTNYFDKLLTGGTVKFINKKKIGEILVPSFSLEQQTEIVHVLEKVDRVITKRKQQIDELDNLIKSRFVELFDTDEYPKVPISKLVVGKVQSVKKVFSPSDEIKYIDISSIDNKRNVMTGYTEYVLSEAPSRAQQHIKTGDIVISTVRPNLRNVAMTEFEDDNLVASSGFCVLRTTKCLPEYLLAIVCSDKFTDDMTKVVTGANYPAIKDSDVMNYQVAMPPMELQKEFAEFVHQVDKLKFLYKRTIIKLNKQKG